MTPSIKKVGWCETKVGHICEHIWLFQRVDEKREILRGSGA